MPGVNHQHSDDPAMSLFASGLDQHGVEPSVGDTHFINGINHLETSAADIPLAYLTVGEILHPDTNQ
jgi:hypothetical protein